MTAMIPKGLCQCGCGTANKIARDTVPAMGYVRGQPYDYCLNHRKRKRHTVGWWRTCTKCKRTRHYTAFSVRRSEFDGRSRWCRDCMTERVMRWRRENPEQWRELNMYHRALRRIRINSQVVERISPQVVYERDEGICGICDRPVDRQGFEVDHIIPIARGGSHTYENVQASHRRCNRRKHDSIPNQMTMR